MVLKVLITNPLFCTTEFIFSSKGPVVSTISCPILPDVAVTLPLILTPEANSLPAGVTINGANVGSLFPAQNATPSLFGDIPTVLAPDPADNCGGVELIVKPPMVPVVADMFPVMDKEEPFQSI